MKHAFHWIVVCLLFGAYACSKSKEIKKEEKPSLATKPDAIAAHDGKSGGVYKGVIIGSSGTVKIILQNNTVSAELTMDGVTKVMTPQNLPAGWTSGQALTNVVFAVDNWQLIFSVSGSGTKPYISAISIPGHSDVAVYVAKETSVHLVKAFEGNIFRENTTAALGAVNFVMTENVEDSTYGFIHEYTDVKRPAQGNYGIRPDEKKVSLYVSYNEEFNNWAGEGVLKGDSVIGRWKVRKPSGIEVDSGYWKTKRTL